MEKNITCEKCGTSNEQDSEFCKKCGKSLNSEITGKSKINNDLNNRNVIILGIIGLILFTSVILWSFLNFNYLSYVFEYNDYGYVIDMCLALIIFILPFIIGLFITKKDSRKGGIIIILFSIIFFIVNPFGFFQRSNLPESPVIIISQIILIISGVLAIRNVEKIPILDDIWKP